MEDEKGGIRIINEMNAQMTEWGRNGGGMEGASKDQGEVSERASE